MMNGYLFALEYAIGEFFQVQFIMYDAHRNYQMNYPGIIIAINVSLDLDSGAYWNIC